MLYQVVPKRYFGGPTHLLTAPQYLQWLPRQVHISPIIIAPFSSSTQRLSLATCILQGHGHPVQRDSPREYTCHIYNPFLRVLHFRAAASETQNHTDSCFNFFLMLEDLSYYFSNPTERRSAALFIHHLMLSLTQQTWRILRSCAQRLDWI